MGGGASELEKDREREHERASPGYTLIICKKKTSARALTCKNNKKRVSKLVQPVVILTLVTYFFPNKILATTTKLQTIQTKKIESNKTTLSE